MKRIRPISKVMWRSIEDMIHRFKCCPDHCVASCPSFLCLSLRRKNSEARGWDPLRVYCPRYGKPRSPVARKRGPRRRGLGTAGVESPVEDVECYRLRHLSRPGPSPLYVVGVRHTSEPIVQGSQIRRGPQLIPGPEYMSLSVLFYSDANDCHCFSLARTMAERAEMPFGYVNCFRLLRV